MPSPPVQIPASWYWQPGVGSLASATVTGEARNPEELESLLEDACLLRDPRAFASLFEPRALLRAGRAGEARGSAEIASSAAALWTRERSYVADPRLVVQADNLALVIADQGTNVVRRDATGAWRYAISLLSIDQQ